jgi:hypothetical protein
MATLLENDLPVSYVMEAVKGPLAITRPGKRVSETSQR